MGVQKRARGAVIPAWTRESRRHGWQTDKAAGIGFAAETLNRHSGNSRSPASFSPPPPKNLLHSHQRIIRLRPSTASINATVIHFYTNLQPPPERTNDQSSQDDARPQRRVHRIESVESIHVESNRRIESIESICAESICVESNRRIESIAIIRVESIRAKSNRRIESVESICIESIHVEIICAEIIRRNIIRK